MIRNFAPKNYDGINQLPVYVTGMKIHTLNGVVPGGYIITLAKLTIGESKSAGNRLSHALFESFSDHGERKRSARTRVYGCDSDFIAAKTAMMEAGIDFEPLIPCPVEDVLRSLGEWFMTHNPEIESFSLVSQTCH